MANESAVGNHICAARAEVLVLLEQKMTTFVILTHGEEELGCFLAHLLRLLIYQMFTQISSSPQKKKADNQLAFLDECTNSSRG